MTEGQALVIVVRLLVPLLILRWPLIGGISALVADALDVVLVEFVSEGGLGDHYAQIDKGLDVYYLSLEAFVAWHWTNPWTRWPALALFAYRLVGTVAFEITEVRALLFIFPNLFENWWLYCVIMARFWPRLTPRSLGSVVVPLVVLLVPKLAQEYLLHVAEAQPWDWTKEHLLGR